MGIKLFFKHLFNSINKRKAQPILLVCVIAVAVAVSITTINIKIFTEADVEGSNHALYGDADYVVAVSSLSPRFMLVNEAKNEFGDKSDVCGVFSLPMFLGDNKDFVYGVATDYDDLLKTFDFTLLDSAKVYRSQIPESAFISKAIADKYGYKVGNTISLNVMSIDFSYTIYGIAENKFFDEYDIMVDTSSIIDYAGQYSIGVLALSEEIDVANQIYFKQNVEDAEFFAKLKAFYGDMKVSEVSMLVGVTYGLSEVILLMIVVIVFFVACVIYCCCYIIASQRIEETNLFYLVGAKSYMLNTISMCELALYWLIGSIIGTLISYPIGQLFIDICGLSFCKNAFSATAIVVSTICIFFATEGSLIAYIFTSWIAKKQRKKNKNHLAIILNAILWLAVIIISCLLPKIANKNLMWYMSLADFFIFILALTLTSKHVCINLPSLLVKRKKMSVPMRYALKNIKKTSTLSNLTIIISILVVAVMSIGLLYYCFQVSFENCRNILNGDYLIMYATDSSIEKLKENENILSVESMVKENCPPIEKTRARFDIYSATDKDVFSGMFSIDELPTGNQAYMFGLFAEHLGLEIGDTFNLTVGGKEIELVLVKKLPVNTNGVVLDAEYFNIPYNYTIVKGNDSLSHEELYDEILATLSTDNVLVVDAKTINDTFIAANSYEKYCLLFMLIIVVVFSTIGLIDNVASSYRSRTVEFYCYSCAGMCKRELLKMKICELIFAIGIGVLLGVLVIPLAYYLLYETGLSQYINLLWLLTSF